MATYAALVSLLNTINHIQNHPWISSAFEKKEIESLSRKLSYMLDFIKGNNSYHGGSQFEAQVLVNQITSAANADEDVIESHIVDQIEQLVQFQDLQEIIQKMDSIKEKVMIKLNHVPLATYSMPIATSSRPLITTEKNNMIGFHEELIRLMDELIGHQSSRQILPIVGIGDIGKTTLAKNVYENLLIVQHFDIRAWVILSQEYSVREILFQLLSCQTESTIEKEYEEQLGEKLHKSLSGRRYMIVLDEVGSIEAWEKIKFYFSDNNNRSRIIITTRLSNVAFYFGSACLSLDFLDEDKSWDLFCEKAFGQASCLLS